jgi:menaquinone-dependent protoporphyrinogen oxidase
MDDTERLDDPWLIEHGLPIGNHGPAGVDRDPGITGQVEPGATPAVPDEIGIEHDLAGVIELVRHENVSDRFEIIIGRRPEADVVGEHHPRSLPKRPAGPTPRIAPLVAAVGDLWPLARHSPNGQAVGRQEVPMKILVAYASRHGATQGIAERIAESLQRAGLDATLRPAEKAGSLDAFDAFVIGSAAYMGGWLGGATNLVRRNQRLLARRPVWLFSSGPIGTEIVNAKGQNQLEAATPKEFAEFSQTIHPRGLRVFFGAYDPDAKAVGVAEGLMGKFLRFMPAARAALPAGDFRDWPAIEAWAGGIAHDLQPVAAAS